MGRRRLFWTREPDADASDRAASRTQGLRPVLPDPRRLFQSIDECCAAASENACGMRDITFHPSPASINIQHGHGLFHCWDVLVAMDGAKRHSCSDKGDRPSDDDGQRMDDDLVQERQQRGAGGIRQRGKEVDGWKTTMFRNVRASPRVCYSQPVSPMRCIAYDAHAAGGRDIHGVLVRRPGVSEQCGHPVRRAGRARTECCHSRLEIRQEGQGERCNVGGVVQCIEATIFMHRREVIHPRGRVGGRRDSNTGRRSVAGPRDHSNHCVMAKSLLSCWNDDRPCR